MVITIPSVNVPKTTPGKKSHIGTKKKQPPYVGYNSLLHRSDSGCRIRHQKSNATTAASVNKPGSNITCDGTFRGNRSAKFSGKNTPPNATKKESNPKMLAPNGIAM